MLDHHMPTRRRMTLNHAFGDAQGALQPYRGSGGIGQGEKRLGGVHVAVGTPVRFLLLPVPAETFAQSALFLAPEILLEDRYRLFQQGRGCRPSGNLCGAACQGDEGMQVGGFVAGARGIGEPAAELGIAQGALQRRYAVIDQLGVAGDTLDDRQGKAMGHTCGMDQFGARAMRKSSVCIERRESVIDSRGSGER